MAELPFDQPIQNISWADSGTKTEPSAGRRSTGWVAAGDRPAPEFNWRYNAVAEHVYWIDTFIPRKFEGADCALEAINKVGAGDRVTLAQPRNWYDATITKETAGAVTHLVSDGLNLYYMVGLTLYVASASTSTEPEVIWFVDVSSTFASIDHISTDGQIVVLSGPSATSGEALSVYTISELGLNPDIVDGIVVVGSIIGVRADSISTTQRVWMGIDNTFDNEGELWLWTPSGGLVKVASGMTGLDGLDHMGMSNTAIALQYLTTTFFVDKTDYATTDSPITISAQDIQGDGDASYFLTTTQIKGLGAFSNMTPTEGALSIDLAVAAGQEPNFIVGDDVAYTSRGAYSLSSGQLLELWGTPSDGPLALAGQYLWTVISDDLVARPVGLRGGEVWIRKSDGASETIGRSDSNLRLLLKGTP